MLAHMLSLPEARPLVRADAHRLRWVFHGDNHGFPFLA